MTETTSNNSISIVNHTSDDEVKLIYEQYERLFRCGDTAYVEERYNDAIQLYSTVLQQDTATHMQKGQEVIHLRFQCYLHRSITYQQIQDYTLALTDIESAIQLLLDNNVLVEETSGISFNVYEIHVCYRQYGIIAYAMHKYKDAQNTFEKILRETLYYPNDTKYNEIYYQNYIQQCQRQQQQQEQSVPVNEPILMDIAPSPKTTTTTSSAIDSIKTNDVKINPATLLLLTPKYQYYQNDTQMVIQIIEPNVVPSNMIVQYMDTQNILVSIQKHGHSITILHGELYDTILPEKCSILYKSDKVVIKLRKERPNYEWQTLLSESNKKKMKTKNTKVSAAQLPVPTQADTTSDSDQNISTVPDDDTPKTTSTTTPDGIVSPKTKIPKPYASHRDWDAIEKDVENEIANETPVGDAAMNQLFQQIYANADDDTKRAMIKSYQTSGGTVLSTNWNEVAQKDYEHQDRIAPDGQEWKTWEGKKLTK